MYSLVWVQLRFINDTHSYSIAQNLTLTVGVKPVCWIAKYLIIYWMKKKVKVILIKYLDQFYGLQLSKGVFTPTPFSPL